MKKPSAEFAELARLRTERDQTSPLSCKIRRAKFDAIAYYRARKAYHAQLLKVYPKSSEDGAVDRAAEKAISSSDKQ